MRGGPSKTPRRRPRRVIEANSLIRRAPSSSDAFVDDRRPPDWGHLAEGRSGLGALAIDVALTPPLTRRERPSRNGSLAYRCERVRSSGAAAKAISTILRSGQPSGSLRPPRPE